MPITSGDVRKFILDHFSDEDLDGFCFMYFQEVQRLFSSGMSLETKSRKLIEYCMRHGRVTDLFTALQKERSLVFAQCFTPPLPTQLDDEFPEIEATFVSANEIRVSEMMADGIIAQRRESIRLSSVYLAGLVGLGVLVMAGALLLMAEPYRMITTASGVFTCSLGALQWRGIIGWREQKSRCETIKAIIGAIKQGQGGVDANTWRQIQAYLWGEMNKGTPGGGKVLA